MEMESKDCENNKIYTGMASLESKGFDLHRMHIPENSGFQELLCIMIYITLLQ